MNTETKLEDIIDGLQHKSPSIIRKSVQNINTWINKQNDQDLIVDTFHNLLSTKLTDLILHRSESVRETALNALIKIADVIPTKLNLQYLSTLIPIIWTQLGCQESMKMMMKYRKDNGENNDDDEDDLKSMSSTESGKETKELSEEIRKLITQLLSKIINGKHQEFTIFFENNTTSYCLQCLNILHLLLGDKCPEIRKLVCQILLNQINEYQQSKQEQKENVSFFKYIFDDYAEYLCLSISKGCMHQRGKIRLISFELLSKIIQENISITKSISSWITDNDKIWKYILYLTLDQIEYIKQSLPNNAFKWISLISNNKNINDLNNIQYAKIWILMLNQNGLNILTKHENKINAKQQLLSCISFIITLINEKISHWQSPHRLFGIRALVSLTLCLESQFPSKYISNLLPYFVNLIESENENITLEAHKCLNLFGRFIPVEEYSEFLFSKFNCNVSIKSYLKISTQIFAGYNIENMNESCLLQICKSLSNALIEENVSIEIIDATNSLLSICNSCLNTESKLEILWLIIQIHAQYLKSNHQSLSQLSINDSDQIYDKIQSVLKLLATDNDDKCLWEQNFEPLYEKIANKLKEEQGYYLFASLIYYSRSFITTHINVILSTLNQINNEKNTDKIRYAVFSILYSLLQNIDDATDWKSYTELILVDILLPNILWKPGKFRLKMRSLALDCIILLYKTNAINLNVTWKHREKFISTLKSRLDDFDHKIRRLSIELLQYILNDLQKSKQQNKSDEMMMKKDELKSLSENILERLDDSKDEIRIITCSTLQSLIQCLHKATHLDLFTNIISTSLIHLDDANEKVQKAAFELLKIASSFHKEEFHTQLKVINTDKIQKATLLLMTELMTIVTSI
mmetsp:Transcript_2696/g.2264  ORF Transcript_2696/g.2264 Transcript_2696/m.2264 type:complete len:865 (+) Transcript_2696:46-2640(+)